MPDFLRNMLSPDNTKTSFKAEIFAMLFQSKVLSVSLHLHHDGFKRKALSVPEIFLIATTLNLLGLARSDGEKIGRNGGFSFGTRRDGGGNLQQGPEKNRAFFINILIPKFFKSILVRIINLQGVK